MRIDRKEGSATIILSGPAKITISESGRQSVPKRTETVQSTSLNAETVARLLQLYKTNNGDWDPINVFNEQQPFVDSLRALTPDQRKTFGPDLRRVLLQIAPDDVQANAFQERIFEIADMAWTPQD